MNIAEVIENHGVIVAADPGTDMIVTWDHDEHVFSVLTGNQNGTYTLTEQYDGEGGQDIASAEDEAGELLDELLADEKGE